ncbi:MAG: glycoside hydrolase family 15 protein, partial [Gemmatimonadota bacterium]|nr:glycoside hydrolase family 15 protein [Gemmatimonadota bacterium]
MTSLDLALVGNGAIGALIDAQATVVWCCFPRFDGDPVFGSLLAGESQAERAGIFSIELVGAERIKQQYVTDTPILVTRCYDKKGGGIEITDFCPRLEPEGLEPDGDLFCPPLLVRQVRPIGGKPSIVVRVTPAADYGCNARQHALGANYISYAGDDALRLTTDAPTEVIVNKVAFHVHQTLTFIFGLGTVAGEVTSAGTIFLERTEAHWRSWVRSLEVAGEWRDAVVRAAITLELNVHEQTGAIVAAMTTSIPEAPNSGRNWDYRYCWPRDACFVVNALSRVGEIRTTERYLAFLLDRAESTDDARLAPMYAIDGGPVPGEHAADCLAGYRGMGPVRIGNKASEQRQNDIYGEAVLTAETLFRHSRASWVGDEALFARLEPFGRHAVRLHDVPDAGLWELRGAERVHTFSILMCWVACDRLAKYANQLDLADRAEYWRLRATSIHDVISRRSWNAKLNSFTGTMEGDSLDASLLLMPRLGFLEADDPRFAGTVAAIEGQLKHGDFVYRYIERDDFGYPENAFLVCTFWYIEALAAMGGARREEARLLFEKVLAARNRHGLLAEDLDPRTLEQWGNFPQTYCMAGIIDCA